MRRVSLVDSFGESFLLMGYRGDHFFSLEIWKRILSSSFPRHCAQCLSQMKQHRSSNQFSLRVIDQIKWESPLVFTSSDQQNVLFSSTTPRKNFTFEKNEVQIFLDGCSRLSVTAVDPSALLGVTWPREFPRGSTRSAKLQQKKKKNDRSIHGEFAARLSRSNDAKREVTHPTQISESEMERVPHTFFGVTFDSLMEISTSKAFVRWRISIVCVGKFPESSERQSFASSTSMIT